MQSKNKILTVRIKKEKEKTEQTAVNNFHIPSNAFNEENH